MRESVLCKIADTDELKLAQMSVRWDVFVMEQDVAFVLEIDARDFLESTIEMVAIDQARGQVIGAARLLRDGDDDGGAHFHVGRVAVRKEARGQRVGEQLMRLAERTAREQIAAGEPLALVLDAQVQASGFYGRMGYQPTEKPRFYDAGIVHQEMMKTTTGTAGDSLEADR